MSELDEERKRIALIDEQIMALVFERCVVAKRIGRLKKEANEEIVNPEVERAVEERYLREGERSEISKETAYKIARAVIDEAVMQQSKE